MADNTSYMTQAGALFKNACSEFQQAGDSALKAAGDLKDEALSNFEALQGHMGTAQQFTQQAEELQRILDGLHPDATLADAQELLNGENLSLDGVVSALGSFASSLLMGVVDQIQGMIPVPQPIVIPVPPKLDLDDLPAVKEHVVTEESPHEPPASEKAMTAPNPLLGPKSILEAAPEPTPATLSNALGTADTTRLDFKATAYPTSEINMNEIMRFPGLNLRF